MLSLALETELEPLSLLHALLAIEQELGRDRSLAVLNGPRTIDLDLLLMGDSIVTRENSHCPTRLWSGGGLCWRPWPRSHRTFGTPSATRPWRSY